MTTATLTNAAATTPAVDPVLARAQFFFDLEMEELRVTIPQVEAKADAPAKY